MRKRIFIVTILLGVSALLIALSVYATTSKEAQNIEPTNENIVNEIIEESDLQEENNTIIDDDVIENTDNNITEEQEPEETQTTVISQPVTEQKQTTTQSSTSKSSSQITTSKSNQAVSTSQSKTTTKTQEQPKQSQSQSQPVQEKKQPTQEKKTPYWCVDGGTHHIAGDGANEHGYYKTWNEAFSAYEKYTADWDSSQYKVDVCACGLYYFWAIK